VTSHREDTPDLENLARSLGELREEVTLLRATSARLERRLDELRSRLDTLAPPVAKRPPKAQGLRQDEVGEAPLVGPGRTE
jgi:chromosome segregation ATPase